MNGWIGYREKGRRGSVRERQKEGKTPRTYIKLSSLNYTLIYHTYIEFKPPFLGSGISKCRNSTRERKRKRKKSPKPAQFHGFRSTFPRIRMRLPSLFLFSHSRNLVAVPRIACLLMRLPWFPSLPLRTYTG